MDPKDNPSKADLWAELDSDSGSAASDGRQAHNEDITRIQAEQQAAADQTAQQAVSQGQAADPFADLPSAVKDTLAGLQAQVAQLTQRQRNVEGHIGGINSKLQQQLQAAQAATAQGGQAPSREQMAAAAGSATAMARLKEDYPEFGAALDAALNERLATLPQPGAPVQQGLTEAEVQARIDRVRREMAVEMRHPGWLNEVQQPRFLGWMQNQANEVRMLAGSDDPSDAIRLLDLYKQSTSAQAQQQNALDAAAVLPGRRGSQQIRQVDPSKMTKDEYWAYLDNLERQKA